MEARARRLPIASEIVDAGARRLADAGIETPRLDAEIMLASAAGVSRSAVVAGMATPDAAAVARFDRMIARRAGREPLAYILGRREFFSLDFEINPTVLIPRPETETIVALALEFIARRPDSLVLDLGTGSGAIGCAIASNAPRARIVACDISPAALGIANRNVDALGLGERVWLVASDCFEAFRRNRSFDLIVSNPPYVAAGEIDTLMPEVRCFEPHIALSDGADGLSIYRRIAGGANGILGRDGRLMVEVGAGQASDVAQIMRFAGLEVISIGNDLAGVERVVVAASKPEA